MTQYPSYNAIDTDADEVGSLGAATTRSLPFRHRRRFSAQSPRNHIGVVPETVGDCRQDDVAGSAKMFDVESLIEMCTLKLRLPEPPQDGIETSQPKERGKTKSKGALKYMKSMLKVLKSYGRSAAKPLKPSSLLLPFGGPEDEQTEQDAEFGRVHRCWQCASILFGPVKMMLSILWGKMTSRLLLVPTGLILLWIVIISVESSLFQPFRSLVDLALPKLALVLSIVAIVGQCWICAVPFATSISSIVSQLQLIVDLAFEEMTTMVPNQISKILLKVKVPSMAAEKLCKVLFSPFSTVLGTIFKIIPKVDSIIPAKAKDPKPLAPFVFIGLLVGLFFAQVLTLLLIGSMLNGSAEILLGAALCWVLGWAALQAGNLIPFLLQVIEIVLNTVIQSLLRKLLPISKLQKAIDTAQSLIPKPINMKKRKKLKKTSGENQSCAESVIVDQ